MKHVLRIGFFAFALSNSAAAEEPPANSTWGLVVILGSLAAGAAITTYGLTIDCQENDTDCHRRASLPIWGGVGVASTGSLVGLCMLQSHAGPSGTALTLSARFD